MEMLKLRCHFKLLIVTLFIIACLIAYKFVIIQRYISTYNDGENHYSGFLRQKAAAHYYGNNLVDLVLNDRIYKDNNLNAFNGEKVIHLDLKGAPPSLNYFHHLFPLLHSLNVTGLLIEYEDVFPYSNKFTHAANTYSKEDIRHLLKLAKKYKLEIIPLIQTFGHLEFVLKVYKFFRLREVFRYPQSICPSQNNTFEVITGMLDEVIALHPGIRYIHIGCDEVYQLGACPLCNARMTENRWDVKGLFLDYVTKIAKYIRSTYPNIKPLMWDDELRRIPVDNLKEFKIGELIEPVVWYYDNQIPFKFAFWEKYSKVFPAVWIASSFKGSSGPDQILPNITLHMENHKAWLRIIAEYSYLIKFKGIVLTGWQRYDHFAVLCELLPVSIPSLVNSLLILRGSLLANTEIPRKVKDVITCGIRDHYFDRCKFPGVDLFTEMVSFSRLRKEMDEVLNSNYIKGWLTEHNLQHGYFNPLLVEELSYKVRECQVNLNRSRERLENELNDIYDSYTVIEWTETFVHPYFHKLGRLSGVLHYIINITEWSPRPIEIINGRKDN